MRRILLLLPVAFLFIFMAFSCDKEDKIVGSNTCSVINPAQDLPWLRDKIAEITSQDPAYNYSYIQQADYQGQTVFIFGNCCPNCNTTVPVYNCQGEFICTLYSEDCPGFLDQIKNVKTIVKGSCNL